MLIKYCSLVQAIDMVHMLHALHPSVPIYAAGADVKHAAQLEQAGAVATVVASAQAGMYLGCRLLSSELGMRGDDVVFLKEGMDAALAAR
jgi:hypothetical protein